MEKIKENVFKDFYDMIRNSWTYQKLTEKEKNNKESMTYYNYLKTINNGDPLYGWIFEDDSILSDTLEDSDIYQNNYIIDILNVYAGELENILTKSGANYEE